MEMKMEILTYGADSAQFVQWYAAKGKNSTVKGTIILVHGGFWRQIHDLSNLEPLAAYFLEQGWAVANIEYRRADCGGDWPAILDDVAAAMQLVTTLARRQGCGQRIVSIGHSVGGQLVLLAAAQVDAVVALAPVTDVERTYKDNLGEGAAFAFFKATPEEAKEMYLQASPISQLPSPKPVLVVHGTADDRVPVDYARDYVQQANSFSDNNNTHYVELKGVDHFQVIDPLLPVWEEHILGWLASRD